MPEIKFEAPMIHMPKPEPKPEVKPIQMEAKVNLAGHPGQASR